MAERLIAPLLAHRKASGGGMGSNPSGVQILLRAHIFSISFFHFFIDWFIFNFNEGRSDTPFKKEGESRSGNRT